jgi:vancomycin resistance protein VanW
MAAKDALRRIVPFAWRVEIVRLRLWPRYLRERKSVAMRKATETERAQFDFAFSIRESPLNRYAGEKTPPFQAGKERNVGLAAGFIDGTVIAPGQVFSYHHAVGRPTRLRGFRRGLELQDASLSAGIGGGCCQVSNLLYLLALEAGLEIVERHRHGLDLFPDNGREVPFGCGATVFFNSADLRFRNPYDVPVLIELQIADGQLYGTVKLNRDPGVRVEVYEVDHAFTRDGDEWYRQNRICRRVTSSRGEVLCDEEVAANRARCLYLPEVST